MDKFFIIAGTEKAGTTSIFTYFSRHPDISPSIRKETDYFRRDDNFCLQSYLREFDTSRGGNVKMEASPGYLSESSKVVENMGSLKEHNVNLVFVLRDPADRLFSSFQFFKRKLYLPQDISYQKYISQVLSPPEEPVFSQWVTDTPAHGCYGNRLKPFLDKFRSDQITIIDFMELTRSPKEVCQRLAEKIGIDANYFDRYQFTRENVTYSPRFAPIQKVAESFNNFFEPVLRKNPAIKRTLVQLYKRLNSKDLNEIQLPETRAKVIEYYRDDANTLRDLLRTHSLTIPTWLSNYDR